jgi:RNA polymerase sigma factor for flagellar operon FliA
MTVAPLEAELDEEPDQSHWPLPTPDGTPRGITAAAQLKVVPDGDIWVQFRATRDQALRNEIAVSYLPLVRYVAGRLGQSLPSFIDSEDLVSYGVFGLLDAIDRFDPAVGVKFETFGVPRIRGAILDELRSLDWAPRSVRSAAREVEKALEELRNTLGREPLDSELAEHLEVDVHKVHSARSNAASAMLDTLQPTYYGEQQEERDPTAWGSDDPAVEAEVTVIHEVLAQAIVWLPEMHQRIVWHYYVDGLKMREIGDLLGIGGSKVCQMYTDIVLMLRERMVVLR